MHVHAAVSFENKRSIAGRGRIRLLEAVGREGSISAAARATGLSYKAAWDAIEGLNTLFGRALVEARSGGARGGGTQLTKSGIQVVETLTRLEGELSRALLRLEPDLRGNGIAVSNLVPGFLLRTSARNALRGVITSIKTDAVSADVTLAVAPRTSLRAIITRRSVEEFGTLPGARRSRLGQGFADLDYEGTRRPQWQSCWKPHRRKAHSQGTRETRHRVGH